VNNVVSSFTPEIAAQLGSFLALASLVLTFYVLYVIAKYFIKGAKFLLNLYSEKIKRNNSTKGEENADYPY